MESATKFDNVSTDIAMYNGFDQQWLAEAVQLITDGKVKAAIFKGALNKEVCSYASANLDHCAEKEHYIGAKKVGRIGGSIFETLTSPFAYADYFRNAKRWQSLSRAMFPCGQYPIDQIRIALDDETPHRVGKLKLEDGVTFAGLIRYLDSGGAIEPHNDKLSADMPTSLIAQAHDLQIACNWMLRAPQSGGALRIYPERFNRREYEANRAPAPHQYGVCREVLSDPIILRPETGDFYLFEADYCHSVDECQGNVTRYTLSTFIGVSRDGDMSIFS